MEAVYNDLQAISYGGAACSPADFAKVLEDGLTSVEFSAVVSALCKQLRLFTCLEQDVNVMRDPADGKGFLMDVSSFLQELQCPYPQLISVPLLERLTPPENRLLLLDFLIGELQAARINHVNYGPEIQETRLSPVGDNISRIIQALGLQAPPANVGVAQLFSRIERQLVNATGSPTCNLPKALLTAPLNKTQWDQLEHLNHILSAEYRLRREMLLKRFDVTVQSFSWSDRVKSQEQQLKGIYLPMRKEMVMESKVAIADVLAAREDLLYVEKTSSQSVRKYTQCAINRIVMGKVPDRGGRPNESFVPRESFGMVASGMPPWKARDPGDNPGRGGGGRVQSGWGGRGHRSHHGGDHGGRSFHRGGGGGGSGGVGRGNW